MEVYIFRHALANFGSKDHDPPISAEGAADAEKVVELANQRFGFKPTAIVSSPLLRARQTAELARKKLGLKETAVDERLYGDTKPEKVMKLLSEFEKEDRVALVSHMPLIFELLYAAIGGKGEVELLNGSIAAISFKGKAAAGKGKLVWLIQPGV
jgi:phosphohistidine phosphatase